MILSDARGVLSRAILVLGMMLTPKSPVAVSGEPVQEAAPQAESPKDKPSSDPEKRIRVKASRPIRREVRDHVDLPAQVDSAMTVSLRARVSGRIEKVHILPGQKVHNGDLLYAIESRPYEAELEKAEAELRRTVTRLDRCKKEVERVKQLQKEGKTGRDEVDRAASELEEAEASTGASRAARDIARLNLTFTVLRSPIDGNVLGSVVQAGNVAVADKTTLATIVSTDPMYVYFDVPQEIVLKLNRRGTDGKLKIEPGKGLAVRVGLPGEAAFSREGIVDSVNGVVDPGTGTVRWRAKLPNPDDLLLPGMLARVRLPIGELHEALLVPERAVLTNRGQKSVIVVYDDGTLEWRVVTTGTNDDGLREVTKGLKADHWIVVDSLPRVLHALRQGQRVAIEKVPIPDGPSSRAPGLR
jgi:multidrug efflux system membrane fusion protein